MSYAWFPDELTFAGRENLDRAHVARYDAKEVADAAAEIELLQSLGLTKRSVLVELGPGTGQLSLAAASVCERVVAVDVSPPMLEQLGAGLRAQSVENVEVVRAGYLSYEHEGRAADVVYSRLALHHLPDFWKAVALTRIHACLRPGGILRLVDVVWSFAPAEIEERIEAWCATAGDDVTTSWTRAELEEHVRDEHSTFTWLLEPMLERCGFEIERAEHAQDGVFAAYVLRAAPIGSGA